MTLALLLALWLSVLARTYSWIIILQRHGIVNTLLTWSGLTETPLSLVYNKTGVYIGMVHILLPFMVMTLVPMLRSIDPSCCAPRLAWAPIPGRPSGGSIFP